MPRLSHYLLALLLAAVGGRADNAAFLETPAGLLLRRHCHECHSHAAKKSRGDLVLDSLNAILTGGQSGPAIVLGEPDKSLLLKAVRHESAELKMPSGLRALKKSKHQAVTCQLSWI